MACPHVAGLLALGMGINPDKTVDGTLECLTSTATSLDNDNPNYVGMLGAGMIDASGFASCMKLLSPTATPTTATPTSSAMPTTSCICDSDAELTIVTDQYASETSWKIETDDESCGTYSEEGGPYADGETEYTHTLTNLCIGFSYTFTITDSWGDGVCCSNGDGSYNLMVGDEVVASGGEFGSEESTAFTVALSRKHSLLH